MADNKILSKSIVEEQRELRSILNAWDPIGAVPEDEYDNLRDSLIAMLHRGENEQNIAAFISRYLNDSVGLRSTPAESREVAGRIFCWWRERRD
jgi:hypothetical protein